MSMLSYTPDYPIPYAYDATYQQPPVRVLFAAGKWLVPEAERPANWRSMAGIRDIEPPKPKVAYVPVVRSRPEPKRKPRKPRIKTFTITGNEIVALNNAGESVEQIAARLGCNESLLFRRRQAATAALLPPTCEICGEPTGKSRAAKMCAVCAQQKAQDYWDQRAAERKAARAANRKPSLSPEVALEHKRASSRRWSKAHYEKKRAERGQA